MTGAQAQQSVNAGGSDARSGSGSMAFSIGQADYTAYQSDFGQTSLGVQQPYEWFLAPVQTVQECIIYPNPATDQIRLSDPDPRFETFDYQLFDATGRIQKSGKGQGKSDGIPLDGLSDGLYFLRIKTNLNREWQCRLVKTTL